MLSQVSHAPLPTTCLSQRPGSALGAILDEASSEPTNRCRSLERLCSTSSLSTNRALVLRQGAVYRSPGGVGLWVEGAKRGVEVGRNASRGLSSVLEIHRRLPSSARSRSLGPPQARQAVIELDRELVPCRSTLRALFPVGLQRTESPARDHSLDRKATCAEARSLPPQLQRSDRVSWPG